jgi:hypothetical protein
MLKLQTIARDYEVLSEKFDVAETSNEIKTQKNTSRSTKFIVIHLCLFHSNLFQAFERKHVLIRINK